MTNNKFISLKSRGPNPITRI